MNKKINFIIITIIISIISYISFANASDIDSANRLAELGIINDHSGNTSEYNLGDKISRKEMLKVMMKLSGKTVEEKCEGIFDDLKPGDWGCKYAEKALKLEYIAKNSNFRPSDNVSKIEALKMIFKAKDIQREENSDWKLGYVNTGVEKGILNESFSDYTTKATRSWIFVNADNTINALSTEDFSPLKKETKTDVVKKTEVIKEGETKIDFINPQGEITDLTKNITVRFSKPMVKLGALDDQPNCPIEITPKLEGKCVWITTSTFQFRPEKGFPIGAKYEVKIKSGIEAIDGTKTKNSKKINISTPKFKIINYPEILNKDEELLITFNSDISIENFKNNFVFSDNLNLDIKHYSFKNIYGENEIKENVISIFPKIGDWGYSKKYNYVLKSGLKSSRGNVGIGSEKNIDLTIKDLLTNYSTSANSKTLITKNEAKIYLYFYEEVKLDKNLFNLGKYDFDIKYAENSRNIDGEEIISKNKKNIIIEINKGNNEINNDNNEINNDKINKGSGPLVIDRINLNILASKISSNSKNINLVFNTKADNQILDYKFINYKKSCLTTKYDISNHGNNKYFDFGENGKATYISKVSKYNNYEKDCKYISGKYVYVLNTRLTPDSDIKLNIKKQLLDINNYPLEKSYNFSFHTNKAMNEDKQVILVDNRDTILAPKNISPLGVAIKTINLQKVNVEVCEGDLDITKINYISDNKKCISKEIDVKDLGFTTNFSVLNLESVFGKKFEKDLVTLKIQKLETDKTEEEIENKYNYYNIKTIKYLRSNYSAIIKKSEENNLLWLNNFETGENLTEQVEKIELYREKRKYDSYGKSLGYFPEIYKVLTFSSEEKGLYKINGDTKGVILITLKNGEKILLNNNNSYYSNINKDYIYITTDRAIYKAGNKVEIKVTARELKALKYNIKKGKINVRIRNSRWEEILNKKVTLNENGSATLELVLDKEASLGNYNISAGNNSLIFAVEEFEKPDFKIEVGALKDNYLYGEIPKVKVSADYYVGSSVNNAEGNYSISTSDFNFDGGKTKGYTWGENKNYWDYWRTNNYNKGSGPLVGNKKFQLNNKGENILEIDTNETLKDKIYNISTTITDPNTKKSIAKNASFKVLNSDIFVGLKMNKYYYNFGDEVKLDFVTTNINGNKKANKDIKFRVYKVDYTFDESTYKTDKKETLVKEENLKTNGSGIANAIYNLSNTGEFRFEILLNNEKYISSKTIYVSGINLLRPIEQEHSLNIISPKQKYNVGENVDFIIQSPVVGVKALVTIEKLDKIFDYAIIDINEYSQKVRVSIDKEYLPNFELKVFLVKNISTNKDVLVKLKDLRIKMIELEEKLKGEADENGNFLPIPYFPICYDIVDKIGIIPPIYRDNENYDKTLLTNLAGLRAEEQKLMQKIIANYYTGTVPVKVNTDIMKLNSSVKIDKTSYLPGDKQEIILNITDKNGNPVNGEAVVSIVDEALLALKNNDTDLLSFFYSDKSNSIRTKFNMSDLIKRFEFNPEDEIEVENYKNKRSLSKGMNIEDESISYDMAEISFSSEDKLKSTSSIGGGENNNATKLRTDFKDSAYYKGIVNVVNGKAVVKVDKLPDNLTTWVIKGYTITKDTKIGSFEKSFKVQKQLNLLPSIPRFFITKDSLEISSIIINNSNSDLEVNASLDITNAKLENKEQTIKVAKNSQKLVSWKVDIAEINNETNLANFYSEIKITASAGNLIDSLQLKRKILPYSTPEYTFTNGSTNDLSYEEKIFLTDRVEKNMGYLDVSIGGTILTNLLKDLDKILYAPNKSLYSILGSIKNGAVIKELYKNTGEIKKYNDIRVYDYNNVSKSIDEVIKDGTLEIYKYQQDDGGLSYYDDCIITNYNKCSNFGLTGDFLQTVKKLEKAGFSVDRKIVDKAYNYYKKELEIRIKDYEIRGNKYRNINSFYKLIGYDKEFINKYLLSDRFDENYDFSNLSKLKIISVLQYSDENNKLIELFIKQLKNSTLIEARGSFIKANSYNKTQNVLSTALGLKILLKNNNSLLSTGYTHKGLISLSLQEKEAAKGIEKLEIENFARFILANKKESGYFYSSYETSEIIESIDDYIKFTKELENIDFEAKGFLNNKELITVKFGEENKFEMLKKSYPLTEYINFGEDNPLSFTKTGTGKLYYDIGLRYYLPVEEIEPRDEGIIVKRSYYNYDEYNSAYKTNCSYWYCYKQKIKNINEVSGGNKGDYLVGEIEIIVPRERNDVIIQNYIPAGAEIVNTNLDTTSSKIKNISGQSNSSWWYGYDHIEQKDEKVVLYASHLNAGTYKYTYVIKLNHIGNYHHRPAVAEETKKPEIWGRSGGDMFEIK